MTKTIPNQKDEPNLIDTSHLKVRDVYYQRMGDSYEEIERRRQTVLEKASQTSGKPRKLQNLAVGKTPDSNLLKVVSMLSPQYAF